MCVGMHAPVKRSEKSVRELILFYHQVGHYAKW